MRSLRSISGIMVLVASSCGMFEPVPRAIFRCTCSPSGAIVRVCAGPAHEVAAEIAKGCLQQSDAQCDCNATTDLYGCDEEGCMAPQNPQ